MTDEETQAMIDQNRVIEDFKERENTLQKEMEVLAEKLRNEKENIRKHHEASNRILQARIDLDVELGLLKKKYQKDSEKWQKDLKAEQEARKIDLIQSQAQLDQLQNEIADLETKAKNAELSGAQSDILRAKLQNAQLMTNRILQTRIEIDGELTALKRKYEKDTKKWETTMQREMFNRDKEAAKAKAELELLKEEMAKMAAERNDFGSLLGRSLKVLFGGSD
jgi:DNA repair exonuclease SbcCD ATPase subunit